LYLSFLGNVTTKPFEKIQPETLHLNNLNCGMALGLLLDSQWCKEAMATTRKAGVFLKS
jgi:hypothetical protein